MIPFGERLFLEIRSWRKALWMKSVLGRIVKFDRIPNTEYIQIWKLIEYRILNIFGSWKMNEYEYRIVLFGPSYSNSSNSERIVWATTNYKPPAFCLRPFGPDFWGGFERKLQKKVHNGSENKKKYEVAEKLAKKYHDLGPNGIVHNSG